MSNGSQPSSMKPIFIDYVPRWVPIVSGVMIVFGAWFGGNVANLDLQTKINFVVALFGALLVLIFFQGRYYWRGQVKMLATDGMRYEALTSVWIGPGRRIAFTATEAKAWTAKSGPPGADGKVSVSAIRFTVRGETFELSLVNPRLIDLGALSAINPAWFNKLRGDQPKLKSIGLS